MRFQRSRNRDRPRAVRTVAGRRARLRRRQPRLHHPRPRGAPADRRQPGVHRPVAQHRAGRRRPSQPPRLRALTHGGRAAGASASTPPSRGRSTTPAPPAATTSPRATASATPSSTRPTPPDATTASTVRAATPSLPRPRHRRHPRRQRRRLATAPRPSEATLRVGQRGARPGHNPQACGGQRQPRALRVQSLLVTHQVRQQPGRRHVERRRLSIHGGGRPRRVRLLRGEAHG